MWEFCICFVSWGGEGVVVFDGEGKEEKVALLL